MEVDFSILKEPEMNANATPTVSPDEALALRRVRKLKAFYIHLTQYVVVIPMLAAINIATSPHYLWFLWAALGWGGRGVIACVDYIRQIALPEP